MLNILMYVSSGLVIIAFVTYFLLILLNSKKKISKCNGFDVTKDIIFKYNSINVIESKSYFTLYNIKRKVIKLATRSYYGTDLGSISLSLIEAGISIVDSKKNKYIDFIRRIFSNLKVLYIIPIIAIFINNATYSISDAKVSIVFFILFSFISYILIDIKEQASLWINDNIKRVKDISKENSMEIMKFINNILLLDKIIFFAELIMICRCLLILFQIS